jgi:hypothetical protein
MELFIRIKDGQPFEHPIFGDNFIQAFPDIDIDNLPSDFAKFNRIEMPTIKIYEVYEGVSYEWKNDIVEDVHHIRPMTEQEKFNKQEEVKTLWSTGLNYASWIFNEELCQYIPPIPYPKDDKSYFWDEEQVQWIEHQSINTQ